jgi:hypothetical protein
MSIEDIRKVNFETSQVLLQTSKNVQQYVESIKEIHLETTKKLEEYVETIKNLHNETARWTRKNNEYINRIAQNVTGFTDNEAFAIEEELSIG